MAHPYLFFLFAWLLYATPAYYRRPSLKTSIHIGIILGLILVTCPVDIIAGIIPLTYGITNLRTLRQRAVFFRQHVRHILPVFLCTACIALPQFLYWKWASGHFFYDTYPGEGFDFTHPFIFQGLFSFKNGWLIYTPIALIPLLFLLLNAGRKSAFSTGLFLFLLGHIYLSYSWTQWNYSPGLGSRPMVEVYAFLSIPLTSALQFLHNRKASLSLVMLFIGICTYLNLLRTLQVQRGSFISEDANYQFSKQMLFKQKADLSDSYAFDLDMAQPDSNRLTLIRSFTAASQPIYLSTPSPDTAELRKGIEFVNFVNSAFNTGLLDHSYIGVSAQCKADSTVAYYEMGRIVITIERNGKTYKWQSVRIDNKLINPAVGVSLFSGAVGQWKNIRFFALAGDNIQPNDILKVYAWNPFGTRFSVTDVQVVWYASKLVK